MPGSNNNNNRHSDEPLDPRMLEQLNAYLDYELSEEQRAQVRDWLRRSPAADNEMATLKATSKVLSELPPVPAPRSFAVRPAMLEQPAKSPHGFTLFGWVPSPSFALSLGSLAAACLLVLVLTAQLLSNSNGSQHNVLTTSAATTPSSGQSSGGLAYKNPTFDSAPSGAPVPAAAPTATTASAAAPAPALAATAATPTTAEVTTNMAMTATSGSTGNGATSGTSAAPGAAASPTTSRYGLALSATASTAPPSDVPNARATGGSSGNNPTAPAYSYTNIGATAPTTPVFSDQANNPPTGGGNISASGVIPQQNTNQTNNFNVLSSGMNYWLVIEIALAVLVAALGLGALIAQRRSR